MSIRDIANPIVPRRMGQGSFATEQELKIALRQRQGSFATEQELIASLQQTGQLDSSFNTVLRSGTATVITGISESGTTAQLNPDGTAPADLPKDNLSQQGKNLGRTIPNPLENYSSFSPLWTLACLTPDEFNRPELYRNTGKLNHIVFSSAGRYDRERVRLSSGKAPEYFIDNFKLTSVIAPGMLNGNTNVVRFEFDVYEPYSMGLFLQSLQVAAQRSNYTNYLIAPYVLKLDILGYNDQQQILRPTESGAVRPKYFVMKLTKVTFNVDESGSKYLVEAVPFNHYAFSDESTTVYNDIKLTGETVEEVLRTGDESLVAALNKIEQDLVKAGKIEYPDVYDIQFPKTAFDYVKFDTSPVNPTSATISSTEERAPLVSGKADSVVIPDMEPSEIGKADFGFNSSTGGTFTFLKEDDTIDEETGVFELDGVTIDPSLRLFTFAQGQSITNIITTIILNSKYGYEAQLPENKENGLVKHFMIDVQLELLQLDSLTGEHARKITFRVVPYFVHETVDANVNTTPTGYDEIERTITKSYNYIYSGQNTDVLKFEIQINNLFYVGFRPVPEIRNSTTENPDSNGVVADKDIRDTESGGSDNNPAPQFSNVGRPRNFADPSRLNQLNSGGDKSTSVEEQVAENFHRAFLDSSSGDLVRVELEILGDPYWLIDHGFSNYMSSADNPTSSITNDNTMNYTSGSVYIYISFKTPDDVNDLTGLYDFSNQMTESPFSGIYRVVKCHNEFNNGNFTQRLECLRMIGQSAEYEGITAEQRPTPDSSGTTVVSDEPVEDRTSVFE